MACTRTCMYQNNPTVDVRTNRRPSTETRPRQNQNDGQYKSYLQVHDSTRETQKSVLFSPSPEFCDVGLASSMSPGVSLFSERPPLLFFYNLTSPVSIVSELNKVLNTAMKLPKRLLVHAAKKSKTSIVLSKLNCSVTAMPARHFSSVVLKEVEDGVPKDVLKRRQEVLKGMIKLNKKQKKPQAKEIKKETSAVTSPSHLSYVGETQMPITSALHIVTPEEDPPSGIWPAFRLMDEDGTFRDGSSDGYNAGEASTATSDSGPHVHAASNQELESLRNELKQQYPHFAQEAEKSLLLQPSQFSYSDIDSNNTLVRAHRQCVRLRQMDTILQNAQRQGRISFYMTCTGEEAIHIGAGAALELQDTVLAQYREAGILMWRGFTLQQFTDQCFSNKADLGKGRQMPIHYGSRALNYQTISSPLGTQIPQATGAAYKLKLSGKDAVAACFFGDGCASTPDFHSGLNFAAVLKAPVIFFCRNNGYAISTSVEDQYNGDGIVSRAKGYGMAGIRVDGNDIFAVHAAVREARKYALENSAPVLIEAMTYRGGHHSTSDDSLRYRSASEVKAADASDPIARFENFLLQTGQLSEEQLAEARDEEKIAILKAMREAERKPDPPLSEMFKDVYREMPKSLQQQERMLHDHLKKYPNKYT
eukprot:scaffold2830_cov131-Cylindrotheca_fusiformis.AAC.26